MRRSFVFPVGILLLVAAATGWLAIQSPAGQQNKDNKDGVEQQIRDIQSMKEILASIDKQTFLVFDVDNTVIEPKEGNLGSDQWYYYLVRKYKEIDGLSKKEADRKATDVWNTVQGIITVRAVEDITPGIIKEQQKSGTMVLGFTARSPDLADKTVEQLKSVGIDYAMHRLHKTDFDFKLDGDTARYTRGVLFIGDGHDKGRALVQFLKEINFEPKRVVFVDDKPKNVESVAQALKDRGIDHACFRYGAADSKVLQFEADTKNIRLYFGGELTKGTEKASKEPGKN